MGASEPAESSPEVVIRIGHVSEVMQEERRRETEKFAEDLRRTGLTVDLQIQERMPGRYGLTFFEWTYITIGGIAAIAGRKILENMADDLYKAAKQLLRRRLRKGSPRKNLGFVIYGPDGKELRRWTTKNGQEDPPEEDRD